MISSEIVAILDCGSQYAKVIDRRIRDLNIETLILPLNTPISELQNYQSIILSGGPESVYSNSIHYDKDIFSLGIPILGICFGMQLMAHCDPKGGVVEKGTQREDGVFKINIEKDCKLYYGMEIEQNVLLTHGDSVISAPSYRVVGYSGDIITSIANEEKKNLRSTISS